MAQAALTEAPLKRKLEGASEAADCKKPQYMHPSEIDGNLAQSDCQAACSSEIKVASPAQLSGEEKLTATETDENSLKGDGKSAKPFLEASGSGSVCIEDSEGLGEGEVLEAALEQGCDDEEQGDEEEEMSEIDTENDSEGEEEEEEEEEEDEGSDDDEDDDTDDEEDEDEMPTTTSSSLQAEAAGKGKGIDEGKGKEKAVDVKGKGIMLTDKGKGKAIVEEEAVQGSDDDDAGYLSEDSLDEVDLNNILPTRTRRRSSSTHYDFVDQGDEDEDDDDDTDA